MYIVYLIQCFFFFNDTATTEIYTLSLHDALPISSTERFQGARYLGPGFELRDRAHQLKRGPHLTDVCVASRTGRDMRLDRKSTRLNSSHANISYAVFCLKKKKYIQSNYTRNKTTR